MRRRTGVKSGAALFSAMLAARVCAQQAPAGRGPDVEAFRREVKGYAELLRLPGLAVAVVQDGKVIYRQSEGYADVERKERIRDDSIFWLASVTKSFAAVIMMQYVNEGKISLDDYLIQYPFTSVGFFPQRIRPDLKLKHVLSHTSEGTPGDAFVYHGGRYNFIYGVFEKVSGQTRVPQAFPQELQARVLEPLKLTSTLPGYPANGSDPMKSRIVTPYRFDAARQAFTVNTDAYNATTVYPASGLLSSIDDLAGYTSALDGALLSRASYNKMTTPFINSKGRAMPYGLGWFTQRFAGIRLHWAYGLGNSDSALLLRVPDRKLTLIVLSNCSLTSEPCRLGAGDVLRSPFAVSFLKHFLFPNEPGGAIDYGADVGAIRQALSAPVGKQRHPIDIEELYTQALIRAFVEKAFHVQDGKAEQLTELLHELDPGRFTGRDPALIHLLSLLGGKPLEKAAETFIPAYDASGEFHSEVLLSIARYYEGRGLTEKALTYYHKLGDTPGFEEQGSKIEACSILGRLYAQRRDLERARAYLWKEMIYTRQVGSDDSSVSKRIADLARIETHQ